jgi:hypothetical protein
MGWVLRAHLPSTFRKCELYPLNLQEVLNRIPSIMDSQAIERNLNDALLKTLELRRFEDQSKKKPRGQKIPAGQNYSAQDSEEEDSRQKKEEGSRHEELEDEELPEHHPGASSLKFRTGVVAICEGQWFLADVAESQEKVGHG